MTALSAQRSSMLEAEIRDTARIARVVAAPMRHTRCFINGHILGIFSHTASSRAG